MTQYDDLLEALDELRKRTSGFRRVALHLHSPESHDWNKTGDRTLNDRTKLLAPGGEAEFIGALQPHFDLVAITDHMKCSYASRVSKATLGHSGFRVLPGMEVNFRPEAVMTIMRLHLLAIMPEGNTPEQFARLFAGVKGIPDDAANCFRRALAINPAQEKSRLALQRVEQLQAERSTPIPQNP